MSTLTIICRSNHISFQYVIVVLHTLIIGHKYSFSSLRWRDSDCWPLCINSRQQFQYHRDAFVRSHPPQNMRSGERMDTIIHNCNLCSMLPTANCTVGYADCGHSFMSLVFNVFSVLANKLTFVSKNMVFSCRFSVKLVSHVFFNRFSACCHHHVTLLNQF